MLRRIAKFSSLSNRTQRPPFRFTFYHPLISSSYDQTLDDDDDDDDGDDHNNNNNYNILNGDQNDDPSYVDLPRPPRSKSQRKPYVTPIKTLIKRAKEEREARKLQPCRLLLDPPDNGLLVPHLVPVAHHVYRSRLSLLTGLSRLVNVVPILRCRFCSEVHIGDIGHEIRTCTGPMSGTRCATHVWVKGGVQDVVHFPKSFHLFDRVGKPRVGHKERHSVPRIPAVVELCIQAGLDLDKHPSKRRTKPVYSIEGRIVDFESVAQVDNLDDMYHDADVLVDIPLEAKSEELKNGLNEMGEHDTLNILANASGNLKELSTLTLNAWFNMVSGVKRIMKSYSVWTCGYCPEVQVGPKGHKVRMCKASKHQSRDGQHAWQEARIDDIVGPNYVWHVQDLKGPPLRYNLKRYYGKAPAVVELCVQAGAPIPDQYRSMMRMDVVPPERDEVDLVA